LQVQGEAGFDTMLPVDLETEEVDVKFHCLDFVENTQDRSGFAEAHRVAPCRSEPAPGGVPTMVVNDNAF